MITPADAVKFQDIIDYIGEQIKQPDRWLNVGPTMMDALLEKGEVKIAYLLCTYVKNRQQFGVGFWSRPP